MDSQPLHPNVRKLWQVAGLMLAVPVALTVLIAGWLLELPIVLSAALAFALMVPAFVVPRLA